VITIHYKSNPLENQDSLTNGSWNQLAKQNFKNNAKQNFQRLLSSMVPQQVKSPGRLLDQPFFGKRGGGRIFNPPIQTGLSTALPAAVFHRKFLKQSVGKTTGTLLNISGQILDSLLTNTNHTLSIKKSLFKSLRHFVSNCKAMLYSLHGICNFLWVIGLVKM